MTTGWIARKHSRLIWHPCFVQAVVALCLLQLSPGLEQLRKLYGQGQEEIQVRPFSQLASTAAQGVASGVLHAYNHPSWKHIQISLNLR